MHKYNIIIIICNIKKKNNKQIKSYKVSSSTDAHTHTAMGCVQLKVFWTIGKIIERKRRKEK